MTEQKRNWRQDLKILRERVGGLSEEKKARAKQQADTLKAIRRALTQGPATIPEIASRASLPNATVVWHIMAMKRYGQLAECGQSGDYFLYRIKEAAAQ
jgi:predicted transcriptional regulator